jgi:hypothetical protein
VLRQSAQFVICSISSGNRVGTHEQHSLFYTGRTRASGGGRHRGIGAGIAICDAGVTCLERPPTRDDEISTGACRIRAASIVLSILTYEMHSVTNANSMSILKGRANWRDARWTLALGNWSVYAAAVIVRLKALAPYALIELVLPGGSVMALLLWLYRRRKSGIGIGRLPVRLLSLLRFAGPLPFSAATCSARSAVGFDDRI